MKINDVKVGVLYRGAKSGSAESWAPDVILPLGPPERVAGHRNRVIPCAVRTGYPGRGSGPVAWQPAYLQGRNFLTTEVLHIARQAEKVERSRRIAAARDANKALATQMEDGMNEVLQAAGQSRTWASYDGKFSMTARQLEALLVAAREGRL